MRQPDQILNSSVFEKSHLHRASHLKTIDGLKIDRTGLSRRAIAIPPR